MVKAKESTPGNKKMNKRKSNIDSGDQSPAKFRKSQDFNNLAPFNKCYNKSAFKLLKNSNKGIKWGIKVEENNSAALNKMTDKQKKAATSNSEDSESEEKVNPWRISVSTSIIKSAESAEGDDSEESDSEEEAKVVLGNGQNEAQANNESGESVEESELNETGVSQADNLSTSNKFKDSDLTDEQSQRTICIRNFPPSLNSECLKMFFSKYGKIEQAKTHFIRVTITFSKLEDALKSLEVNGMEYDGNHLLVNMYTAQNSLTDRDATNAVFVDYDYQRMDLSSTYKLFSECGIIADMFPIGSIVYIWFESAEAVTLALAKSNSLVNGKTIIVEKASKEGMLNCQKKYENYKKNKRLNTPGSFRNMGRGPRSGFIQRGGDRFTRMY